MKLIRIIAICLLGEVWSVQARAADFSVAVDAVATREISEPNLNMAGYQLEAGLKVNPWLRVVSYYERETFRLSYTGGSTAGTIASFGLGAKFEPVDYVYAQPSVGRVMRTYGTAVDTDYRYGADLGFELPFRRLRSAFFPSDAGVPVLSRLRHRQRVRLAVCRCHDGVAKG